MAAGLSRRGALKLAAGAFAGYQGTAIARPNGGDQEQVIREVGRAAEPLPDVSDDAFGRVLDRFGSARVVLLGESTHGTSEFYQARAALTKHLVAKHGFTIIALEADWPDASHLDAYARELERPVAPDRPFHKFPTWMWRNAETRELVEWVRQHNASVATPSQQVGFHGLDLYGLAAAADNVAAHLSNVDPEASTLARRNYECLRLYRDDPTEYASAALRPGFASCEEAVSAVSKRLEGRPATEPAALEAIQNARSVVGGERYYRTMAAGGRSSWNLRDQHMFDTLLQVLQARGPTAKAIVWAHNSHVGDASATEMGRRGEHNIGQLCRRHFGSEARLVGFGTDRGTVMAALEWGGAYKVMPVRPSLPGSYGALFREPGRDRFLLDLRAGVHESLRQALKPERLERAIGVMYLPGSERVSHYFGASLPDQFDAYLWFTETRAVTPLGEHDPTLPAGHPFAR